MERIATVTRSSTYLLTALAAALFILLCWLFGDGLLAGPLWNAERWVDSPLITYLLLALIILAGIVQANRLPPEGFTLRYPRDERTPGQTAEPLFAKLLFGNVFWALIWLPLRFFVGREWLGAGFNKVGNPAWMGDGEALRKFWTSAVAIDEGGQGRITYDWYRGILQYMLDQQWHTWFAKVVVLGEILVGLGLLLGGLAGIAAFFGIFMNFNYGLAGSASTNPVLMALGLLLVLAWRTAGTGGSTAGCCRCSAPRGSPVPPSTPRRTRPARRSSLPPSRNAPFRCPVERYDARDRPPTPARDGRRSCLSARPGCLPSKANPSGPGITASGPRPICSSTISGTWPRGWPALPVGATSRNSGRAR